MMEAVSPLSSMSYLEHCFGMVYNVCVLLVAWTNQPWLRQKSSHMMHHT